MGSRGYPRASSALQHRHCLLLVDLQQGDRGIHRLAQGINRVGVLFRHLLPRNVSSLSRQYSREGHSQIFTDLDDLLYARHGRYGLLHLVRRRPPAQSRIAHRYLCKLRIHHGYRSGYRLSVPRQDTHALVQGPQGPGDGSGRCRIRTCQGDRIPHHAVDAQAPRKRRRLHDVLYPRRCLFRIDVHRIPSP